jgi:hypothetical protein
MLLPPKVSCDPVIWIDVDEWVASTVDKVPLPSRVAPS